MDKELIEEYSSKDVCIKQITCGMKVLKEILDTDNLYMNNYYKSLNPRLYVNFE